MNKYHTACFAVALVRFFSHNHLTLSNELLKRLREILDHPHSRGELKAKLGPTYRKTLAKQLKSLLDAGEIVKIRGGRYGLPDKMNLIAGELQGHPDGFGFVMPEDETEKDIFIGPRNFRQAMHGDRVLCRMEGSDEQGRPFGGIVRILERAHNTVTGLFESRGRGGIVIPTQKRIVQDFLIPAGKTGGAKSGQIVTAKIVEYPQRHQSPTGEVTETLGYPSDPKVAKKLVIRQYELPEKFPAPIEKTAGRMKPPTGRDIKGRLDLRDQWVITIDGENARDFDDAVSIKKIAQGYELSVHIADVSHYVRPNNALDREAFERATSTYFPDSVIPMLPFKLSNDVCSLKPGVDRLTLSAIMVFSKAGVMKSARFVTSVINSRHRMTYTEAAEIIDGVEKEKDAEKSANLQLMKKLCDKINARRVDHGSIDFDLPEPEFLLDVKGDAEKIVLRERNSAHRLIEEFMLAANRSAAGFLADMPALYRIHPEPDKQTLDDFFDFSARLGYVTSPRKKSYKRLQEVLGAAKGKPEEKLMNFIMLRTMKQASYSPNNIGHFGLGFEQYSHFTSPIRRYPDLVTHRLIKSKISKTKPPRGYDEEKMVEMGRHCSVQERTSESAERDVINGLKVRFVADREGETFSGIISGVTAFGIFVELDDIFVEGLLRVTSLHDDYYEYQEKEYSLVGKRNRKVFRLGNRLRVRIKSVDLLREEISLEPADAPKSRKGRRGFR